MKSYIQPNQLTESNRLQLYNVEVRQFISVHLSELKPMGLAHARLSRLQV